MQEELTRHQIEWEVMECPSENGLAQFIIEALEIDVFVIAAAALPTDDGDALEENVEED